VRERDRVAITGERRPPGQREPEHGPDLIHITRLGDGCAVGTISTL